MPRVTYSVEHIIHKLREAEVLLGQGQICSSVAPSAHGKVHDYRGYRYRLRDNFNFDGVGNRGIRTGEG